MLVELAIERQEALPALIYESRPAGGYRGAAHWENRRGAGGEGDVEGGGDGQQGQPPRPLAEADSPQRATDDPDSVPSAVAAVRLGVEQELSTQGGAPRATALVAVPSRLTGSRGGGAAGGPVAEGRESSGGGGGYVAMMDGEGLPDADPGGGGVTIGGAVPEARSRSFSRTADGTQQPLIDASEDGDSDRLSSAVAAKGGSLSLSGPPADRTSNSSTTRLLPPRESPASSVSNVIMGLANNAVVPMSGGHPATPRAAPSPVPGQTNQQVIGRTGTCMDCRLGKRCHDDVIKY